MNASATRQSGRRLFLFKRSLICYAVCTMRYTKLFGKTTKSAPHDTDSTNARLLTQAGFVSQLAAGIYTYLPLGLRVMRKISDIVREEMNAIDGQEVLMPTLVPKSEWDRMGRWDEDVAFKLKGHGDKEYALGWSHEEVITPLVRKFVNSYKDFPVSVYQIQNKFRNEARAKSGMLRGREFLMKDLYSFHLSEKSFLEYYEKSKQAYLNVFRRCGLDAKIVEAGGGVFTEKHTHEFQVATPHGEDTVFMCDACDYAMNKELINHTEGDACPGCKKGSIKAVKAIEVGNIFPLETRYTDPTKFDITGEDGKPIRVIMGCYGIGISRLMGSVVEVHHDDVGIVWPKSIAPFDVHLVMLGAKKDDMQTKVQRTAESLYDEFCAKGVEVLFDDRDTSAGEKFADADLIGIPLRLVVSERSLADGGVEWKLRSEKSGRTVRIEDVQEDVQKEVVGYLK